MAESYWPLTVGKRVDLKSEYHCSHDMGDFDYVIIDWRPFHYWTVDTVAGPLKFKFLQTDRITPTENGCKYSVSLQPKAQGEIGDFLNNIKAFMLKKPLKKEYKANRERMKQMIIDRQNDINKMLMKAS